MTTLVTGAAGFVGFHIVQGLLSRGRPVTGLDNLNAYYDVGLKERRLSLLQENPSFDFERVEIGDRPAVEAIFERVRPRRVIHLAAQAGVRYSISHPHLYAEGNLLGFLNILEACRHHQVEHLVFASSSSVYGANTKMPFSVHHNVDHPVSLYAATKKSNELMAHAYAHLYGIPTTGLRFFTVYGPWGRPDMAYFLFTKAILEGTPIDVFNEGKLRRDFTYIDDIVDGVLRAADRIPTGNPAWSGDEPDPASSKAPYRIYNIGNNEPVELARFIRAIELATGRKAKMNMLPMQPGDVLATWADISDLARDTGYSPSTSIEDGIARFVEWYRDYYGDPGQGRA